ncbi:heparinase II/III domain-containing protein [Roseibium litorale]|uniref:Heparinase II/III family protein n=1 Tax=Roseibium litorale TaxID=2803841 RepID=A0ABR9CNM1_9HYPH|nr:heparinase II/III family protein [Roseibium litorale]MBD8892214.1 heparinase II/III family protein [Roseibium litorale]
MFQDAMKVERLLEGLISTKDWKPFPGIEDRGQWNKAAKDPRLSLQVQAIRAYADEILKGDIDPLTGTMYMSFMTTGDRLVYEENYFRRRYELSHLVIAECLSAKGIYLDRIIDYIWAILGEVTWCVPAHNFAGEHEMVMFKESNPWKADDPMPVPGDDYLDLFACETAATLAETCYLLRSVLLEKSPALYHRIHQEVDRRALQLLEGPKLYGWYLGRNNWTAWCAHNLLLTACYVVEDKSRLTSIAAKLMVPMQRFFDTIEDSGSCIEGPSYWMVSAGRLAAFTDLVETRFQIDLAPDKNQKYRNFGEHIAPLHIGENRFVNFADGSLKIDFDHGMISRYALKIGSAPLASLVWKDVERVAKRKLSRSAKARGHNEYARQFLVHLTRLLFWTPDLPSDGEHVCEQSVWLPDMQVMLARQSRTPGRGVMLSAIAGSNDLHINHHSHNDVGHFSVYLDGEPLIIDLGQGAYSKSTFTEKRYDKWHISSEGHNVPEVNGLRQRAGTGSEARNVSFSHEAASSLLSLDASPAYFETPGSRRLCRQVGFHHISGEITIQDEIDLGTPLNSFLLPVHISDCQITLNDDGTCRIQGTRNALIIQPDNLVVEGIETVRINDPRHLEVWGRHIFRIRFAGRDLTTAKFGLKIRPEA